MRSFYATLMLALTLSFVSIPSYADTLNAKEGGVDQNSAAQGNSSRQGGSENSKSSEIDASKNSSSMNGSAAGSMGSSESNPFGNVMNTQRGIANPVIKTAPESSYVKSTPEPSNYVKSTPQASNYVKSDGTAMSTPAPKSSKVGTKAVPKKKATPVTRNWR